MCFCSLKEGNVLFNDVGHVVKHHSDSQRKNPIATIILQGIGLCYTRLEREIAQWVHHEESIWWSTTPWANALPLLFFLKQILHPIKLRYEIFTCIALGMTVIISGVNKRSPAFAEMKKKEEKS